MAAQNDVLGILGESIYQYDKSFLGSRAHSEEVNRRPVYERNMVLANEGSPVTVGMKRILSKKGITLDFHINSNGEKIYTISQNNGSKKKADVIPVAGGYKPAMSRFIEEIAESTNLAEQKFPIGTKFREKEALKGDYERERKKIIKKVFTERDTLDSMVEKHVEAATFRKESEGFIGLLNTLPGHNLRNSLSHLRNNKDTLRKAIERGIFTYLAIEYGKGYNGRGKTRKSQQEGLVLSNILSFVPDESSGGNYQDLEGHMNKLVKTLRSGKERSSLEYNPWYVVSFHAEDLAEIRSHVLDVLDKAENFKKVSLEYNTRKTELDKRKEKLKGFLKRASERKRKPGDFAIKIVRDYHRKNLKEEKLLNNMEKEVTELEEYKERARVLKSIDYEKIIRAVTYSETFDVKGIFDMAVAYESLKKDLALLHNGSTKSTIEIYNGLVALSNGKDPGQALDSLTKKTTKQAVKHLYNLKELMGYNRCPNGYHTKKEGKIVSVDPNRNGRVFLNEYAGIDSLASVEYDLKKSIAEFTQKTKKMQSVAQAYSKK